MTIVTTLRNYQNWMKDGIDRDGDAGPSIDIDDIDGDETFGAAADLIEELAGALEFYANYEARELIARVKGKADAI